MLHVEKAERTLPTLAAAKEDALVRAQGKAERLCKGFDATTIYRFKAAKPDAQEWECGKAGTGFSCGFEGQAICETEEKSTRVEETCRK